MTFPEIGNNAYWVMIGKLLSVRAELPRRHGAWHLNGNLASWRDYVAAKLVEVSERRS
jgi:hypothetical protein